MAMSTDTPQVSQLPQDTIEFAHRMFDAAREGNATLLLAAIDAGLPPNLTNEKGNTLLMLAAYAGHAELVRGLVERGADPNRLNDRGQSPIAGAIFKREDKVARVLIEKGADPRAGEPNAIACAQMFGRMDLLDVLGACEGEGTVPVPSSQ